LEGLLDRIGFRASGAVVVAPGEAAAHEAVERFMSRIDVYDRDRDMPAIEGTCRISPHLRFGTVSARELLRRARGSVSPGATKWIAEIAWRDFYQMLLHHFPETIDHAFQRKLESVVWDDPETDPVARERFEAWKDGRTGYPFVDAAMRELRATGWMHNRCRMVVASFLTKDLHIHWKLGERWFARWLLDIELASNVGGWQWSAGTGADAQPWFRIFNPVEQSKRWDADGAWIRRWCPELAGLSSRWLHAPWTAPVSELERAGIRLGSEWPRPVVDHGVERGVTLDRFGRANG
jgi:deoxyribodipyrimidine photo-lyase